MMTKMMIMLSSEKNQKTVKFLGGLMGAFAVTICGMSVCDQPIPWL